ncbi:hypothetical protein D9M70_531780 [compost metagenome]
MRTNNLNAQIFLEVQRCTCMVDMAMRDPNGFYVNILRRNCLFDPIKIAAGINHYTLFSVAIEKDSAVLLKWRHWNDDGL